LRDVLGDQDINPEAASGDELLGTLVRSEPRAEILRPVSQNRRTAGDYYLAET
jgi:hypothetical protein